MRWVVVLLAILLVAGALRALVDLGSPPDAEETSLVEAPAPEVGPTLEGSGDDRPPPAPREVKPGPGIKRQVYAPVPDSILALARSELTPAGSKELWGWVRAKPSRFLDLLAAAKKASPDVGFGQATQTERVATAVVGAWNRAGIDISALEPYLLGTFREYGHSPYVMLGVQEALRIIPGPGSKWLDVLEAMARSPAQPGMVRVRSARRLVQRAPDRPATVEIVRALLDDPLRYPSADFRALLSNVAKHPDMLEAVVPSLIARAKRRDADYYAARKLLEALVASGVRTYEVLNLFARHQHDRHGSLRGRIDKILYGGPVEDVLAWMEQAAPRPRMTGVLRLRERGVEPRRLHPHLLAVLASGHGDAMQRAVDSIPLLGVPSHDVLPVLEEALRREDRGPPIIAVKALGALARTPGDHDAVVQRLYVVARSSEFPRVRITAVQSILMHDTKPAAMIEVLGTLLDDSEPEVRREAVDALGELAGEHKAARAALEGARNDGDEDVRELIAYWLDETDEDDER